MRDRYSFESRQDEEISVLKAKNEHLSRLLDSAQSNLESVFERIRNGEEVYLNYKDGTRIYIQAVLEPKNPQ
jgi:uncharacterized protein YdcH (DUF465 family)